MGIKMQILNRNEMKHIMAGSNGQCRIAIRNGDGSFAYYSQCTDVGSAQLAVDFYNESNPYEGGSYASGYCCASCGEGGFSNATPCDQAVTEIN